jgi:hypothetical protein
LASYKKGWVPAGHIPDDSFLFCGADPAWTPEKEGHTTEPVPGSPVGRVVLPEDCPLCGGLNAVNADRPDPIGKYETLVVACARCERTHYEGSLDGEKYPSGIDDSGKNTRAGKNARKVKGRPVPAMNAYLPAPEPKKNKKNPGKIVSD